MKLVYVAFLDVILRPRRVGGGVIGRSDCRQAVRAALMPQRRAPALYGTSPSAPCSGRAFEHAGARGAASVQRPSRRQVPEGKVVPVTADQPCLTEMTICALPLFIVRVSGEHVPESRIPSDTPCQAKRRRRRRRLVQHLPIGMKGREVKRNVRA